MNPLLIFGASTRAAAFSARRAGFSPLCGDLFADADLRSQAAQILMVPDYPDQLSNGVRGVPHDIPWIYTGALENSPEEVERLCQTHLLWGNGADVIRRCRDPWQCATILQQAGLPALELRSNRAPPSRDEAWLLKPLRSAGGRAITIWGPTVAVPDEPHYFQRYAVGTPISGAFLAGAGWVQLLGVSQQLAGSTELHVPQFGYCGSVHPLPITSRAQAGSTAADSSPLDLVRTIGTVMGLEFDLRGLFGIDFIDDGRQLWMTELNPRYTASMELIEYRCRRSLLVAHSRACSKSTAATRQEAWHAGSNQYCAKVVLYADRHALAPDLTSLISSDVSLDALPELADIPVVGTHIWPGQPVLTCLGAGDEPTSLVQKLIARANALWDGFPGAN